MKEKVKKLNPQGYRFGKNGKIIRSIEKEAIQYDRYRGLTLKFDGVYYFFNRKQGSTYVYLP